MTKEIKPDIEGLLTLMPGLPALLAVPPAHLMAVISARPTLWYIIACWLREQIELYEAE
jgi:hypothetical protein